MAINRRTLRLVRRLLTAIGEETDDTTRTITRAWVRAWDELASGWQRLIADLTAAAARAGRWPSPWQLARVDQVATTMAATQAALTELSRQAGTATIAGATTVIAGTAAAEPAIMAAQLPARMTADAAAGYAAKILPSALDLIVQRTTEQITSTLRPLSTEATEAMRRALVRGVSLGSNPEAAARNMVNEVQGAFNGGLTRALTIARTEMLDAYRRTSQYAHQANDDVLDGWMWHSALQLNTCPACWSMHGMQFPLATPGPLDHQQGRCARVPVVKPWRDLGIDLDEPADQTVDAKKAWFALSRAEQDAIFGPARAQLVRAGKVAWTDLPVRRENRGWRPSYVPRPVRDLQRIARNRRAA